jgi:serine/threonine protein phosphatase PrpC
MKVYKILKIGEHHINHCEDYLIEESLGNKKKLFAVMDGCTMGTDSYFASTLVGKLLRKIAVERSYQSFYNKAEGEGGNTDTEVKEILQLLMFELRQVKNLLSLNDDELLCTLVILVVDISSNKGYACVIGDGLICVNGELTEYEQDNMPDYLGYHLGRDFEEWYKAQKQFLVIDQIKDISISTDGIFTFEKRDKKDYPKIDAVHFLLINMDGNEFGNMLDRKLVVIDEEFGLKPTDDLGIIRLIKDSD